MKPRFFPGPLLALALLGAAACSGAPPEPVAPTPTASVAGAAGSGAQVAAPTVDEAKRFLDGVDVDLRRVWVAAQRAGWVNENFINEDTDMLSAQAQEANMEYLTRTIKASRRFDGLSLPEDLARKMKLLKIAPNAADTVPAPSDAAKRTELAALTVAMKSAYGTSTFCPPRLKGSKKECLTLDDLSNILAASRKPDELLEAWTGWHAIAPPIKPKFARYVELGNEGAREIGFHDVGELWKAGYDMTGAQFEAETDRLWNQVKPLYDELHCYVRGRLRAKYGKDVVADKAPIPAHLLGNMWAQEWGNVYDLLEPYKGQPSLDVTSKLKAKKLDEKGMVKIGEAFFVSLGFDPLPEDFWKRSLFKKPLDREVECHASAWDPAYANDLRIKMCIEIKEEDLLTIHHELGHDYYYHSYYKLPIIFQQGANDGFHEGIGDTLALSVTPSYLKQLGLLDRVPDNPKAEINHLLKVALGKVAFLPFGKLIDQWRWDVFAGKTPPSAYNKAWWDLRLKYQGVAPPTARSEQDFDPGAKYHVPANVAYVRYFLANIYQFQFHRALCKAAGHKGPLNTCSIYGSKAAGEKLRGMLAMGATRPWPEAMKALSGETAADASAILEYFEPLQKWLKEQNQGQACGW